MKKHTPGKERALGCWQEHANEYEWERPAGRKVQRCWEWAAREEQVWVGVKKRSA